jgi:KDO2-lipid IV(A) lauroyltransferase
MKDRVIKIKFIIEFFFIYLIYLFLNTLPINTVTFLGSRITKIIGPFTKTNSIIKKNYLKIIPNSSTDDIKKTASKSWSNMGKTFFELMILPKIVKSTNMIQIKGLNNLEDIKKNSEQVIFIGIHESNWEILLPTINKMGFSVGGIYRHINNPHINKLILKIRKKTIHLSKSFYTPKGKQSAKDIIIGIQKGLSMVLLIDQKDSAGEIVSFFNIPVKTQIGFLKIAKKYNMKIIPVHNTRDKNNNYILEFYPSLESIIKNKSDIEAMNEIHKIIESWIKKDPSNWFLQHNRFN